MAARTQKVDLAAKEAVDEMLGRMDAKLAEILKALETTLPRLEARIAALEAERGE